MYKIYINGTPLYLKSAQEAAHLPSSEQVLVARYAGKPKVLLNYADMLEKRRDFESVTLYAEDVENLYKDFQSHYKIVKAAGGVVFNLEDKTLLIFRRGSWDLPKGKIDKGETPEAAAVREVQEETGLQQLTLGEALGITYHTYKEGKIRILKPTYWYKMQTTENQLIPQTEEDIEQAVWVNLSEFLNKEDRIYGSIRDILQKM